ncbi:DNA-processing protein DprA [Mycoplasma sp. 128]|uniref:DNA-processing protein DprA n=1 Tax=Mycoplasma sp. 3341 TaxID=3447506 RepID=UPI003F65D70E
MNEIVKYFSIKYNGDWDKIYHALEQQEPIKDEELENIEDKFSNCLSLFNRNYPDEFLRLAKPPFTLFYQGKIQNLHNKNKLAFTGAYLDTKIEALIDMVFEKLKNIDCSLVTTVHNEVERYIFWKFYDANKPVILISTLDTQSTLDKLKISAINDNLVIISELYKPVKKLEKKHFEATKRLCSSLASKLVIFSSLKEDKNIDKLIDHFIDRNKDVYAFPSTENDEKNNNNELINEGAKMITSFEI